MNPERPAPADLQPLLAALLAACRQGIGAGQRPVLGLNGPVGAGKSTLARQLQRLFAAEGLQLAVASIDDAYLPLAARRRAMAGNPFGVGRVPPGSHEPELLQEAIAHWRRQRWLAAGRPRAPLELPRFDKTLCQGEGDRTRPWHGEADVVLLEGWLLGCRPLPEAALQRWCMARERHGVPLSAAGQAWLQRCNGALAAYAGLWAELDGLVMLWPRSWQLPRRWRFQAEARQRRSGGGWLPPAALDALVRASLESLPAELYQRPLLSGALWVRELDGRRHCSWQGRGDAQLRRLQTGEQGAWDQASSSCSSATG